MSALDTFDPRRARHAPGLLRAFNDASVLSAADVHVAVRLTGLAGEEDEQVALAAAFAVRGPRLGHVYVDLRTVRDTATVDTEEPVDLAALPWPDVDGWLAAVAASDLVAVGEDTGEARPLRLVGSALYLDRYWREERAVARDLLALAAPAAGGGAPGTRLSGGATGDGASGARLSGGATGGGASGARPSRAAARDAVDEAVLGAGIARLFGDQAGGRQALAAAAAVVSRLAVVAGGPGTGKTTTVAQIVALLAEQARVAGAPAPLIALAAPTGKAAARLQEAVHGAELDEPLLRELRASTLHRLLGWRPGSHSRFRHDRGNRLPHDVVIVDETSMVSLSLMGRLVEAVRPDARLILVGDPGQLTSIEAGAVLGDIVGPAADGPRLSPAAADRLARITGHPVAAAAAAPPAGAPPSAAPSAAAPPAAAATPPSPSPSPAGASIGDAVIVLDRVHRFGAGIATLADAIRRGDADATIATLRRPPAGVRWLETEVGDDPEGEALAPIRASALQAARAVAEAAAAGDADAALEALGAFRLLCAHRRGPYGVSSWTARIEAALAQALPGFGAHAPWYVGRPLLVTANDDALRLANGDTGVVVRAPAGDVTAAFARAGGTVTYRPGRLGAIETAHAMTIHKAQGSQAGTAAVILPEPGSPLLTRELLYTAVTRARDEVVLAGSEEAIRVAVGRPAARASGLRRRLWEASG